MRNYVKYAIIAHIMQEGVNKMNSELLTEKEVREYIESELDYLNLDETMFNQYVKFIMKIDRFRKCNVKTKIYNVNGVLHSLKKNSVNYMTYF